MKIINHLIVAFFVLSFGKVMAQNFESLPKSAKDSILIAIAKEGIMKYGPDWWRDYPPEIRQVIAEKSPGVGKVLYELKFPYDTTVESFYKPYSTKVLIYADSKKIRNIYFGSGAMHDERTMQVVDKNGNHVIAPYETYTHTVPPPDTIRIREVDSQTNTIIRDTVILIHKK